MLSVKQGDIKYHFLSLLYDSTWDWTSVFRIISEHSTYYNNIQVAEVKLRIFLLNKRFYYKTRLFSIKKKPQNQTTIQEDRRKTVNLFYMSAIFFFKSLRRRVDNRPSKRFACLQNKLIRHFIPFLLNSNLKRTNICMGSCICFVFLNASYNVIKRVKVWTWWRT